MNVTAVGEILWDVFPEGPRFGGAPANFACHCAALGARASLVSAVGQDELGDLALVELEQHRVEQQGVSKNADFPTGQVQVELDAAGKPSYHFGEDEAWDHLAWSGELASLASEANAVCFGTLGQRSADSRATIQRFLQATSGDALRVLDINLRAPYFDADVIDQSLKLANVLKLNDEELERLSSQYSLTGSTLDRLHKLAEQFELRLVAMSRGEAGAVLLRGTEVSESPGVETTVADTVGAGDAFTAAMVQGLLLGRGLQEINEHACHVAAYVCSQPGATPALPESLTQWS